MVLPDHIIILLLNIVSIVLIVSDRRWPIEQRIRERYGIDRHWWIPPLALISSYLLAIVEPSAFWTALWQKGDIILLIFAFAFMARGLGQSGFFRHVSYRIVHRCEGDTARLITAVFVMTAALTFFTTNDVVVFLLTPIIVEIAFVTDLQDARLLLLAEFIAANTLSMGLLTGSPTNLIIADELGIDFISYLGLMIVPALAAFTASYLLIRATTRWGHRLGLGFDAGYTVPEQDRVPEFTAEMRNWIVLFLMFVASVAVVTHLRWSLLWSAVAGILVAGAYWSWSDAVDTSLTRPLRSLPYGIAFFGMTFFTFAEQFSRTGFVTAQLLPAIRSFIVEDTVLTVFSGVFGSGIMVNVFNDLPAAAMVSQLLPRLQAGTVLMQATVAGLNIGTYVTPIGALAGLIWLRQMRQQRERHSEDAVQKVRFPARWDLVRYGLLHFLFAGIVVSLALVVEWWLLAALA